MNADEEPLGGEMNGIGSERRTALRTALADARNMTPFSGPWHTTVEWTGGFKADARTREHVIGFDEPGDLAGGNSAATPHEHVLAAIGACLVAGVVLHATLNDVSLRSIEVDVSGTFDNVLRWAGLGGSGSSGHRSVEVRARISADASDDAVREVWERSLAGSPVTQTVSQPIPVVAVMDIVSYAPTNAEAGEK